MLLFFIFSITLLSFGGLFVQINNSNPYALNSFEKSLFFVNLAIFLAGLFTLIGLRFTFSSSLKMIIASLRTSIIISAVFTILVYFNACGLLTLYSAVPIIIAGILLELFFRATRRNV